MPKITSAGASFPEGREPDGALNGAGEEMHGTEHPADGTRSPEVGNDGGGAALPAVAETGAAEPAAPPAPPRTPPRRTPPPPGG
jgi:hypothetical protein